MNINKILVPIDFSNISSNLIEVSIDFAKKFNAELFLFHAIDERTLFNTNYNYFYPDFIPPINIDQEFIEKLKISALKKIDVLLENYKINSSNISNIEDIKISKFIELGIPNSLIMDFIDLHKIDLVIIGNQGLTGLKHIFLGSTSDYIVHHSKVPVLVVKI